jgi:CBS domain-containing protein
MGVEAGTMFASRLAGLPVLDPNGERVGRLADLVAVPAARGAPLVGAVVRVRRRPIFISSGRFEALDERGLRLSTGQVNVLRFERRDGELLVLGELLDRTAVERATGEQVRVNDIGVARSGPGFALVAVDVVPAGSRLRRAHRVVPWSALEGLAPSSAGAAARAAAMAGLPAVEMAAAIMELRDGDAAQLLAALDDERAADVLQELPEDVQARLIETLGRERGADVIEAMDPDDAADLLGDLSASERTAFLAAMEPDEAAPLRRLLAYRPDTAGGLMTSRPVLIAPSATVAEAVARMRDKDVPRALGAQAFLVRPPTETPTGRLLGTVSMQRLLRELPSSLAAAHLDDILVEPLAPDMPGLAVAEHMAAYNLLAAPVCDPDGRVLGAVSVDDVIDFLLPAGWRRSVHPPEEGS